MMKIFVSQPMAGSTKDEILAERERILDIVKRLYASEEIQLVNSYFELDVDSKRPNVRMLGMSIELLAEADLAVFGTDWAVARGCTVEYSVAKAYHIDILDLDE